MCYISSICCSLDYLKQVAGSRTVPIEIGSKYTDENWSQSLMTMSQFIERFMDANEQVGRFIIKFINAFYLLRKKLDKLLDKLMHMC